jgi:hypothetical protein
MGLLAFTDAGDRAFASYDFVTLKRINPPTT